MIKTYMQMSISAIEFMPRDLGPVDLCLIIDRWRIDSNEILWRAGSVGPELILSNDVKATVAIALYG